MVPKLIKLYDCDTAPSPQRARILLAEKGIEYERIQVDLRNNEQLSDAYKSINPQCTVPFLVTEEGVGITENLAIAAYLEAEYPNPPMLGRSPVEKAKVLEWNCRTEFEGLMAVQEVLRNTSKGLKGRALTGPRNIEQIPELATRGRERLANFFLDLNEQLENNNFIAGSAFSFADITAMVTVGFAKWVKTTPSEDLEALHKWYGVVSTRPSAQA